MQDWLVWQLLDSAYPGGGLAHSNGLEAAWQTGLVGDPDSLAKFVRTSLRQSERSSLPFLLATHRQPNRLPQLDAAWDLQLNNHVANRASRAQGQAIVSSVAKIFAADELREAARKVRAHELPGHLATLFGYVTQMLGIEEDTAHRMFLFLVTRSIMSSAVRLGIVGPMQAQAIQAEFRMTEAGIGTIEPRDVEMPMAVQTAPILDLISATQDRLYSRLFQS